MPNAILPATLVPVPCLLQAPHYQKLHSLSGCNINIRLFLCHSMHRATREPAGLKLGFMGTVPLSALVMVIPLAIAGLMFGFSIPEFIREWFGLGGSLKSSHSTLL